MYDTFFSPCFQFSWISVFWLDWPHLNLKQVERKILWIWKRKNRFEIETRKIVFKIENAKIVLTLKTEKSFLTLKRIKIVLKLKFVLIFHNEKNYFKTCYAFWNLKNRFVGLSRFYKPSWKFSKLVLKNGFCTSLHEFFPSSTCFIRGRGRGRGMSHVPFTIYTQALILIFSDSWSGKTVLSLLCTEAGTKVF